MTYSVPQWEERTPYGMRRTDPYARLFEERIVFLGESLTDEVANGLMAQLLCLQAMDDRRDVNLYINSPGGSFSALTAVYDTMWHLTPDIRTFCLGQAAGVAAVLLAAGTPGKRRALQHSRVLIQQPSGEAGPGQSADLEIQALEIIRMRELLERMLARHTGRPGRRDQPGHRA